MADTGIMCSGGQVVRKAGKNASTVSVTEAYTNDYIYQAESFINVATKKNWSDAYAGLNVDVKGILTECVSNLAAIYVLEYDMSGANRIEVENRINILRDRAMQCVGMLMGISSTDFMAGA